jgi:hypothetical protein
MATAAQVAANRMNAQLSTGPTTDAGKAAVAQNHLSHGLSSKNFALLPSEDPAAFQALADALAKEHKPSTPSEAFLVSEMARAQWKLERAVRIEAEILSPGEDVETSWAAIARRFQADCSAEQALLKINRYEQAARRAWHKSLEQLRKLRSDAHRMDRRRGQDIVQRLINEPLPRSAPTAATPQPIAHTQNCDSKPMPAHLQRELDAHIRRDPLFNPRMDASQMSKELRKWFARQP